MADPAMNILSEQRTCGAQVTSATAIFELYDHHSEDSRYNASERPLPPSHAASSSKEKPVFDRAGAMSDIYLRAILGDNSPCFRPRLLGIIRDYTPYAAMVTLLPNGHKEAKVSVPFICNLDWLRDTIGCKEQWFEVDRNQEYDDRWPHLIRVQSNIKVDATDPLQIGRIAQFEFIFFFENGLPRLRNCVMRYDEDECAVSDQRFSCGDIYLTQIGQV
jgi:hypothetical protein